jgi:uncharacterized membrane protein YgcG
MAAAAACWLILVAAASVAFATSVSAGPPYPDPVYGQRVYDYAGLFSADAIAEAEATIFTIQARTGVQIAVYTQVKPESDSLDRANADARALMDQWGVGRKGFDDGLVILFDMQTNLRHGQVSLYAGSGFRAAYLTEAERQGIFNDEMLPRLKAGDFDGALAAALQKVDAAATPEHAKALEQARVINAIVGIVGLALALFLMAFVFLRWYDHGRDPVYVTDNSVLMPAPPEGLTPAMATLLMADRTSSRTVSAGMVDLAARGLIEFREERHLLGTRAGIALTDKDAAISDPEGALHLGIRLAAAGEGYVKPESMSELAPSVSNFKNELEDLAVARGWLIGRPRKTITVWMCVAIAEIVAGAMLITWTMDADASGGWLGGIGFIAAGLFTLGMAQLMPSRTRLGSMLQAMLLAYGRTLQWTMVQAQSMGDVVKAKALPWVTTPDQVMAWGVAFGLNHEIDAVLRRTADAARAGSQSPGWYPGWWVSSGGQGGASLAMGGGARPGLYSSSAIPDVGSMMSALGSIGSSSSHSGGGGFGGGGGGGGGGAGGGF